MFKQKKPSLPSTVTKPFAFVHSTLSGLGFAPHKHADGIMYEISMKDPSTGRAYRYRIPSKTAENGAMTLALGEARFVGAEPDAIPKHITDGLQSKLRELCEYLDCHNKKLPDLAQERNGSMAQNEAEMKRLGKEMSTMKTNSQLREDGMIPDPAQ